MAIVHRLYDKNLINPPPWLPGSVVFEGFVGSTAYGCQNPKSSDRDVVALCVPKLHMVFPHLTGHIQGFGTKPPSFQEYQKHHIKLEEKDQEYDLSVISIVKFFHLAMDNNPNILELLYLPQQSILKQSDVYLHMRDNRHLFPNKKCWHSFRGYAYGQLGKLKGTANKANPKRKKTIQDHGYDTKNGYHIVRLMLECEQLLESGEMVLDRDREIYKSIRRGEWSIERIQEFFHQKEKETQDLYRSSTVVPYSADEKKIRNLLHECLEIYFGRLDGSEIPSSEDNMSLLSSLEDLVAKHKRG